MKCYKGFNDKLQCTPDGEVFQYEVGKTYVEDGASLCKKGFHACEAPLGVFAYYPPSNSRYCEVELEDISAETDTDSKRVGKKITIGAEIGIPGLVKAHVERVKSQITDEKKEANTGEQSVATNTGRQSTATVKGEGSVAVATGYGSKARGALGCAIVVAERDDDYNLVGICAAIVDGETIKPDTWYTARGGKLVEAEEG